jgi:predicted alternative tryptophan synthase beta-subunit
MGKATNQPSPAIRATTTRLEEKLKTTTKLLLKLKTTTKVENNKSL